MWPKQGQFICETFSQPAPLRWATWLLLLSPGLGSGVFSLVWFWFVVMPPIWTSAIGPSIQQITHPSNRSPLQDEAVLLEALSWALPPRIIRVDYCSCATLRRNIEIFVVPNERPLIIEKSRLIGSSEQKELSQFFNLAPLLTPHLLPLQVINLHLFERKRA